GHGVAERARDVLLSKHVGKPTGAPAEVERAVVDALAHGHPPAVAAVAAGRPVADDERGPSACVASASSAASSATGSVAPSPSGRSLLSMRTRSRNSPARSRCSSKYSP